MRIWQIWIMFQRQIIRTRRMPMTFVLAVFQPIIWILLFSQLFRSVVHIPGFKDASYISFLVPGIAVMTAMFGSLYSGLGMLGDIQSGFLTRCLAAPADRPSLIMGPILNCAVQTTLQAGIILLVGLIFGSKAPAGIPGALFVIVPAVLLSAAFGAISQGLAILTRQQQLLITIVNFFALPMTFLSTMMMSRELMPSWMRVLARINPVDWAVAAARDGYSNQWSTVATPLALLAGFSVLAVVFALRAFTAYQRAE